jgi:diguanylate cyclase (GGDEF)-like protein/PAS domain S-box-containing protein
MSHPMCATDRTGSTTDDKAAYGLVATTVVVVLAGAGIGGAAEIVAWTLVGALTLAAAIAGLRRNRPEPRSGWLLMTAGIALWVVSGVLWLWADLRAAHASADDALVLLSYVPLTFGQIAIGGNRGREHHKDGIIDGCIFALVALLLFWVVLIEPDANGGPPFDRLVGALSPLLDLLLLVGIVWVALLPGRRSLSFGFLGGAYAVALVVEGAWYTGTDLRGLFPITFALFAAALVHPSCRHAGIPPDRVDVDRVHPGRFVLLTLALFAGPLSAMTLDDDLDAGDVFVMVCSLALIGLVILRFVELVRDNEVARRRFRLMAENVPAGIYEFDDQLRLTFANAEADRLFATSVEALETDDLVARVEPEDRDRLLAAARRVLRGRREQVAIRIADGRGGHRWVQWRGTPVPATRGRGAGILSSTLDITDLKAAERALELQATHDPLTGLPNRRRLTDEMRRALARGERHAGRVAVMFCDLDGFKTVNDVHGHDVGDTVLIEVAQRLRGVLRRSDTVTRIGGDEFVVLCEDAGSDADLDRLAARIIEVTNQPIPLADALVTVGVSVGVAVTDGRANPVGLLRDADGAMYRAKALGRNRFVTASAEVARLHHVGE